MSLGECRIHVEHGHTFGEHVGEVEDVEFLTLRQMRLDRRAEEVGDRHAGYLDGVLERQKDASLRAFVGLEVEEINTLDDSLEAVFAYLTGP